MEITITAGAELTSNNSANNLYDGDNTILNNSIELDWAQITYALNVRRLLFITNHKSWLDFHNENLDNSYKYSDFTAEQLCERFLKRILPNIYDYELNDNEEFLLTLFGLRPDFERTEHGFIPCNNMEDLYFPKDIATIQPLMESAQLREMGFHAEDIHLSKQIVITDTNQQIMNPGYSFNAENAALLSIIFSSDEDLPSSEMLTIHEVHRRFKAAKYNFELKGQLPKTVDISVDNLLKKLRTMSELKTAITKLLENFP